MPRYDQHAGDRRFAEWLRLLARTHEIDFCGRDEEVGQADSRAAEHYDRYARFLTEVGIAIVPYGWRHVERALLCETYDLGLFESFEAAAEILSLFQRLQPQARTLTDTIDVHYARERAAAELGLIPQSQADATYDKEIGVYRASDVVVAISELDRRILECEDGLPLVGVVPLIVPLRVRPSIVRSQEALFVGGFLHTPNFDGLRWFVDDVWPKVRESAPDATLFVIGSNTPPIVHAMEEVLGVRVLGFVPDVDPYLDRAAAVVAPLRFGAGMKGKVVEAMASGVPVVTTNVGIQGLDVVCGREVLIADKADDFAAAIVTLFQNPERARSIGLAGQRYIETLCGPEVVARNSEELISKALQLPKAAAPPDRRLQRIRFNVLRVLYWPHWSASRLWCRIVRQLKPLLKQLVRRTN